METIDRCAAESDQMVFDLTDTGVGAEDASG
jgi:hypothetical protein